MSSSCCSSGCLASQGLDAAQIVSAALIQPLNKLPREWREEEGYTESRLQRLRGVTGGIMGPETGRQRPRSYGDPIYITESVGTILSSCNKIYDPWNYASNSSWRILHSFQFQYFVHIKGTFISNTTRIGLTFDPLLQAMASHHTLHRESWSGARRLGGSGYQR